MVCNPRERYGSQAYKGFAHVECHARLSALLHSFGVLSEEVLSCNLSEVPFVPV